MGTDKSRLRLNGRSVLSLLRATANQLGYPVRIIRRDLVKRCGPLGGILTALKTTRAEAVLFLACDMPLISSRLLKRIVRSSESGVHAIFTTQRNRVGFPFLLPASARLTVESQIAKQALSVRELAAVLPSRKLHLSVRSHDLFNINTPRDKAKAESLLRRRGAK